MLYCRYLAWIHNKLVSYILYYDTVGNISSNYFYMYVLICIYIRASY